jgi:hypothetical protein
LSVFDCSQFFVETRTLDNLKNAPGMAIGFSAPYPLPGKENELAGSLARSKGILEAIETGRAPSGHG